MDIKLPIIHDDVSEDSEESEKSEESEESIHINWRDEREREKMENKRFS